MNNVFKLNEFSNLSEISYSIFHGPSFATSKTELHHQIFHEWRNFWEKHYEETQSSSKLFSDELLRTTFVLVLHKANTPIGILFCSHWNLWNPVHQHSRYLSQYPKEAKAHFESLDYKNVLSLEYLTIHPDWRFQNSKLPLSEVLLGLGLKIFYYDNELDGVISIARRVVKVQDRMAAWGMREVCDMTLHNNPCSITTCNRKEYRYNNPDQQINSLTNYFLDRQQRIGFPEFSHYRRAA